MHLTRESAKAPRGPRLMLVCNLHGYIFPKPGFSVGNCKCISKTGRQHATRIFGRTWLGSGLQGARGRWILSGRLTLAVLGSRVSHCLGAEFMTSLK